jgi:CBS domain-containing protein/ribosome-associated translation inhibitor RaiA
MTVGDIMTKKVISCSKNDTLYDAIAKIKKDKIEYIPIVDKKKLIGMVSYLRILYDVKKPSQNSKLTKLMFKPFTVNSDTSVKEALMKVVDTGIDLIPVIEEDNMIGVVSDYDILQAFKRHKLLSKIKVKDLMRRPITIYEDDTIAKARSLMRNNRIDVLPIINKSRTFLGFASALDLINRFMSFPTEKQKGKGERIGKMIPKLSLPVKAILRKDIDTVTPNMKVSDALNCMFKWGIKSIPVIAGNKVQGILVRMNMLKFLRNRFAKKGIPINITGNLTREEFSELRDITEYNVKKFLYFVSDIKELKVVVQKSEGKKHYEIYLGLIKKGKDMHSRVEGKNFRLILTKAIHKIDKQLRHNYLRRSYRKHE